MVIKTKKYEFPKNTYIKIALLNILKVQWWVFLIYLAIVGGYFFIPSHWWITGATIALVLYILFWLIQFAGVTQMEQGKVLFERLSYEIDSRQILIKLNNKQGMPIKWEMIKSGSKGKDHFLLLMSKAQMIYLPFKIFTSEAHLKWMETIMTRKGLIKETAQKAIAK
ncbi:MAG: YcxB family protein [Bacteroidetes bacterium]|nr:YcxB family protein [Bacteroidota bacterium]MDA1121707.1 YcxB family protein [Bacteroidota bacterium]